MVAKKKLKLSAENGGDDYHLKYDDLVQRLMRANGEKKKLLMNIANDIGRLSKKICDPDPPGCSGPPPPPNKFAAVLREVQKANTDKKARLKNISSDIDKLLQKICDPDPPGCSINLGGKKSR
jgi:hypothetical protein